MLVSGRPGTGKTSFALKLISRIAQNPGKRILVFSLELPPEQLVARLLGIDSVLKRSSGKHRLISKFCWKRIMKKASTLAQSDINILQRNPFTVKDVIFEILRLNRIKPVDLVVIDYLQLITDLVSIGGTDRLRDIARKLKIPIVVLSQMNRNMQQCGVNDDLERQAIKVILSN